MLSAEACAVFGAHGIGQDTILRNLVLLNVLWDGGEMAIDRRFKPSFLSSRDEEPVVEVIQVLVIPALNQLTYQRN